MYANCPGYHVVSSAEISLSARVVGASPHFALRLNFQLASLRLQYQKQLRLQEARSILRNERRDVGTVSRRVGYESASQFSREYSRLFGNPPVREINNDSRGEP